MQDWVVVVNLVCFFQMEGMHTHRFPSEGEFYSAESDAGSPLACSTMQKKFSSADMLTFQCEVKRPAAFSPSSASSCPEVSMLSALGQDSSGIHTVKDCGSDEKVENSNTPGSDVSSDSRRFIEPDIVSINKLLNFDSADDSDEIADETGTYEEKPMINETIVDHLSKDNDRVIYEANKEQMLLSLKDELRSNWSGVSARLAMANLSLEEIGHIRSVHAKADIEALPDDGSTKKNVIKGKICFQCVKTKFGLFCRSIKCPLCCQAVCSKCVAKISATPSISLPMTDTSHVVESSPLLRRRSPTFTFSSRKIDDHPGLSRTGSFKGVRSSLPCNQGSILTVCLDCREMVVSIIRARETAEKMDAARSTMLASLQGRDLERSNGQV